MATVESVAQELSGIRNDLDEVAHKLESLTAEVEGLADRVEKCINDLDDIEEPEPGPAITFNLGAVTSSTVRVWWATEATDIQSWRVGRDGQDALGTGPWSTTLPATAREFTFRSLKPGTTYTFILVADTTGEDVTLRLTATTPTSTTPPPVTGDGVTAAKKYGWGTPHAISDEFTTPGRPDPAKWALPGPGGWDGHNGNGRRMPENAFVENGMLVLRGDANGNTGWIRQNLQVKYGRWEVRSRSVNTGTTGGLYHPLHLIWPAARNGPQGFKEYWPEDGELDFLEYEDPNSSHASAWLHYPHPANVPIQQAGPFTVPNDMTQFHNYAFEWNSTGVRAWIDGEPWYEVLDGSGPHGRGNIQDMPSGSYTCQLDNFTGDGGLRAARFEMLWVRYYPV